MKVTVYKASSREYLYVYVAEAVGLDKVPAGLLTQFGEPTLVMAAVEDKGYYLQMPPVVGQ